MEIDIGINGKLSATMITEISKITVSFGRGWRRAMTASSISSPTDELKIISYLYFGSKRF